jgi:hypothetical protein
MLTKPYFIILINITVLILDVNIFSELSLVYQLDKATAMWWWLSGWRTGQGVVVAFLSMVG